MSLYSIIEVYTKETSIITGKVLMGYLNRDDTKVLGISIENGKIDLHEDVEINIEL